MPLHRGAYYELDGVRIGPANLFVSFDPDRGDAT
jgi:hypothetical protein